MANAQREAFRTDINGLRAWAVVVVVLFHFGVSGFSAGFVGVDVFFVISGFLMTGIIVRGLEKKAVEPAAAQFTLSGFYLQRARRIVPALLVLCLVLIAGGWFVLPVVEYKMLGKHVLSALSFVSNIVFWREDGYFDGASHEKWLLHTWSLSVEWQFYLLLPVMMVLVWKIRPGRRAQGIALTLALLVSLALCLLMTPLKPVPSFYLLPTRAWEMLAGGLVMLFTHQRHLSDLLRKVLEVSGFALIIGSVVLLDDGQWPGWRALFPVVGSMLVLTAACQQSWWTGTRLAQWLGDCSYSLYLWHWPVVVALTYLQLQKSPLAIVVGLAVALLLASLSYRFVEQRAQASLRRLPQAIASLTLVAACLLALLPGVLIVLQQGINGRLPATIETVFSEAQNYNPRKNECLANELAASALGCKYGEGKPGVIVVGDSHAAALVRAVERALPDKQHYALDWTMSNCPTIANIKAVGLARYGCGSFVSQIAAQDDPALAGVPLIIINRGSNYLLGPNEPDRTREVPVPYLYVSAPFQSRSAEYLADMREGMISTACEFAKHRPVYMLRPIPELKLDVPKTMGRALMQGKQVEVSVTLDEYRQRNAYVWETQDLAAARCGVKLLDPLPYLCHDNQCYGDHDGQPLYIDDDHMSERGGDALRPLLQGMFEPSVEQVAKQHEETPTTSKD